MKAYQIIISKTAQKQLDSLSNHIANPIIETIKSLSLNPRPNGFKKLKGRDGYRIRKGYFRIVYEIYDKVLVVEVISVGHRKSIYKN
jgi:mRNA interferase RelE/StbE